MLERLSGLFARSGRTDATKSTPSTPSVRAGAAPRWLAEWHDADEHAVALIEWAQAAGFEGSVLATDMMELHRQMCRARGWLPRKWNPVARAVALRTTGGRKFYAHVGGHRLRAYPLHWTPVLSAEKPRPSCVTA